MCKFKSALLQRFTGTDEGPVTQYLGCQLIRDRPNRTSQLVQTAYTERLFRTFDMWDEVHTDATPMIPGTRLVQADRPETPNPTLQRRYCRIIGSIGCLVQMTRCDMVLPMANITLALSTWQPPNVLLHMYEALTTKVCRIATLAPRTETF